MKKIGIANNHLHSGYYQLLISAKGYIDKIDKLHQIFQWFKNHQTEMVKWILWQRSTYANNYFAKKWKLSFWYIDNLMRGVHNTYFKDSLPCFFRDVDKDEFVLTISGVLAEFEELSKTTKLPDSQGRFVKKLKILQSTKLDLSFIPSGWKELNLWVDSLDLPKYNKYNSKSWTSVFRSILAQVYLIDYERMIDEFYTAKVTQLLRIPFEETKLRKLPYLMVSGPKYVIKRSNNEQSLKSMREDGYFELRFKFLEDNWSAAINVRVIASRKMRKIINRDIVLKSMIILQPRNNDVDIQLIFEGAVEEFISINHLKTSLSGSFDKTNKIGIDINRKGEFAVVTNIDTPMPAEIFKQSIRWDKVLDEIRNYQSLIDRSNNIWKKQIYKSNLASLHRRKINLRKDYHQRLANWVGQQMVAVDAGTLILEDLDVRTYGNKGALAKAIESMADNTLLYAREVFAVSLYSGKTCKLKKINARNSSKIHVNCGGKLLRDIDHYDIAPCSKCNNMVNTHKNAALFLVLSTIQSQL